MGQKDLIQKTLEGYNEIFADIFNVLLFDGKEVLKPDNLIDATKESIYKVDGKYHEQQRDVGKYWQGALCHLAMLGIENQTKVLKCMPLRVVCYDGVEYKRQVDAGEDPFHAVCTIVLYFGEGKWNQFFKLSDSLEVPDEIRPFFNDYNINVFSIGELSEETRSKFKSSFKYVADYFYCETHNIPYKGPDKPIDHFYEVLDFIRIMSNDKNIDTIYNQLVEGKINLTKEEPTMGFVTENLIQEGIEKGEKKNQQETVIRMLENNFTDEQIKTISSVTDEQLAKIKAKFVAVPSGK